MPWMECARGASYHVICVSFPTVGRLQQALFTFIAALELSGCLLFTDPINKAPVVTIMPPRDHATQQPVANGVVTRNTPVDFYAEVSDDKDSPATIPLSWASFTPDASQSCQSITAASWTAQGSLSQASDVPYEFTASTLNVVCVCVLATDHNGATGQACQRIAPINPRPIAVITDESVVPPGQTTHPLCSTVHLSGRNSTYPTDPGDQVPFNWTMVYSGTGPAGSTLQLTDCPGIAGDVPHIDQCFVASVPGQYTVSLTITDTTTTTNDAATTTMSAPVTLVVNVDVDKPACIQATEPAISAATIVLARTDQRSFVVKNVADDCDPYPSQSTSLQFVWSLFDPTRPDSSGQTQWVPQSNADLATFTVSPDLFPNVRPGDTVGVRVEARDKPTQDFYANGQPGGPICSQDTQTCYSKDSSGNPTCVRWTTWNVQFQP